MLLFQYSLHFTFIFNIYILAPNQPIPPPQYQPQGMNYPPPQYPPLQQNSAYPPPPPAFGYGAPQTGGNGAPQTGGYGVPPPAY